MSRMNELSCCIANLKAAAAALLSVAETLTTLYSGVEYFVKNKDVIASA